MLVGIVALDVPVQAQHLGRVEQGDAASADLPWVHPWVARHVDALLGKPAAHWVASHIAIVEGILKRLHLGLHVGVDGGVIRFPQGCGEKGHRGCFLFWRSSSSHATSIVTGSVFG